MAGPDPGGEGSSRPPPRRRRWTQTGPPPAPTHRPEATHRPASVVGRPSYGIDAPSVVVVFFALTFALAFAGVFVGSALGLRSSASFWVTAAVFLAVGVAMVHSSLRGKALVWDDVLDGLALRGDEQGLDAGCGRGLVLIALARRVPAGGATGVDIWRNRDQSGNARRTTELNVQLAQVADRVTVLDGDLRRLPVPDDGYDVVTASFAIHNLATADDRAAAAAELVRVARPGGRIVILDIARTGEEAAALTAAGAQDVEVSGRLWTTFPPSRVITASSPATPASPGTSAGSRR